ncbi:MAG: DUF4112 domain-containing protein [Chitinivibrionales bacterium]|nr:DUF4112 domain-containing protein [Chitinivibrionales bacterium]MBD3358743.1 DUF4112 domain-containing protein [Chitinivibrionales bacterium]
MDSFIRIPGTRRRIGLDGIIGIIPGIGDTIGAAISSFIVITAALNGAPFWVLARMVQNLAVEWAVGLIPFAGDLFDFAWKANNKNVKLFSEAMRDPRSSSRKSAAYTIGMSLLVVVVLGALFFGVLLALRWIWGFVVG